MSEPENTAPEQPDKAMQDYLKTLSEIAAADQQETGMLSVAKIVGGFYRGLLADGFVRDGALDITARLWARYFKDGASA